MEPVCDASGVQAAEGSSIAAAGRRVQTYVLPADRLDELIAALKQRAYDVLGPTLRDSAVVYEHIEFADELPRGWTDSQEPGRYRLEKRQDEAFFGYVIGPQSWKKFLYPAQTLRWAAERTGNTFRILNNERSGSRPYALLGVRPCELSAIGIHDRIFLDDRYPDTIYEAARSAVFIIVAQCTQAAATCFCDSMQTGPCANSGFDLALTELAGGGEHRFVIEAGSERGTQLLAQTSARAATDDDLSEAEAARSGALKQLRSIDNTGIRELLYNSFDHPRWEQVAARCLACGNCTMVCPTCFCITVEDTSDVSGQHAARWRYWDSCFTLNFSYIHGGSVRNTGKARYRQWMTHKLAAWIDQFGVSGCVGCGRCITWCPVGIDITEEVRLIREAKLNGNS